MRLSLLAAFAALLATPALADWTTGTVAVWDAASTKLTLTDRTIWTLGDAAPAWLAPGQRIRIDYVGAASAGIGPIEAITLVAPAPAPDGGRG